MEKKKVYKSKPGEVIKLVKNQIQNSVSGRSKKIKHQRIERIRTGTFKEADLRYLIYGTEFLRFLSNKGIEAFIDNINERDNLDSGKIKMAMGLNIAKEPIDHFLRLFQDKKYNIYSNQREISNLEAMYEIIQNSRDGIITKKIKRTETSEDGKKQEVEIEIPMSEEEIAHIVRGYTRTLYEVQDNQFTTCMGVGMSALGLLGRIYSASKDPKKGSAIQISIGSLIEVGSIIAKKHIAQKTREEIRNEMQNIRNIEKDLIRNEAVSIADEEKSIEELKSSLRATIEKNSKILSKMGMVNTIKVLINSILTGNMVLQEIKEKDSLNANNIARVIYKLSKNIDIIKRVDECANIIYDLTDRKEQLEYYEKELENIVSQIEEKVDPLKEVQGPFEKIEIKDFHGKFYPIQNPNTGKIEFRHMIEIPEFSAKRGDIVLLSGKSGRGKSTFIRWLKRGDINNRNAIKIDGKETVDKLGRQFIALKADKELGIHTNVLKQLIDKEALSELTIEEKERLGKILSDVGFQEEDIFNELVTKNYNQFSTGQKKRLSLAQTLYKANGEASILLVDEPVGNVEDELIDEQLKIIKQYAKKSGMITILCTHRVDLAQKYVDKQYHISKDGVIKEVKKEEKQRGE